MSGHSKWSTIKRKKGANDQKRGQIFTKLSQQITLAVSEGGGMNDPENNFRLRLAIERAKAENMPKENIQRAIDRAGGPNASSLKEIIYEGFGPGGSALIIVAATDNPNRTHSEVKTILDKSGGKLGSVNSVAYMFDKCGVVVFDKSDTTEEKFLGVTETLEALDVDEDETSYIIYIPFEKLGEAHKIAINPKPSTIDVFYRPTTTVELSDSDKEKVEHIMTVLEELDDVPKVYSNYV